MSATNRGAIRAPADHYPTPAWVTRRLLEAVDLPGGTWLEPSAGDGAIIRVVNAVRKDVSWMAVELREECRVDLERTGATVEICDFLQLPEWSADVAILNPPFSLAFPIVCKCLEIAPIVCVLLRLNWLEGDERNSFLRETKPSVFVIPNRPSFTGEGTDSVAYAWMVWGLGESRLQVLPSTPIAERKNDKPKTLFVAQSS